MEIFRFLKLFREIKRMYEDLRNAALNTDMYNEQAQQDCFGIGRQMNLIAQALFLTSIISQIFLHECGSIVNS